MPFKSAKQEKFLRANHPEIAERWTREHGSLLKKKKRKRRNQKGRGEKKH